MARPGHDLPIPHGYKGQARSNYARGVAALWTQAALNLRAGGYPRAARLCEERARRWMREARP